MMSNLEFYSAMASYTATHLTDSWQRWTAFLTTASRLYKYPFHEQLMIFASARTQRPVRNMTYGTTPCAGMCGAAPRASLW